ncbi:hypothetical protein B0H14DRAFT_2585536 [Mycena olivaceomarginata]|nr:hypothetical protein B0H14DRAFT_2585536 [Mycena olivaceomarginata]
MSSGSMSAATTLLLLLRHAELVMLVQRRSGAALPLARAFPMGFSLLQPQLGTDIASLRAQHSPPARAPRDRSWMCSVRRCLGCLIHTTPGTAPAAYTLRPAVPHLCRAPPAAAGRRVFGDEDVPARDPRVAGAHRGGDELGELAALLRQSDRITMLALVEEVHEHVHHDRHGLHVSRVRPHADDAPQRRDEVGSTRRHGRSGWQRAQRGEWWLGSARAMRGARGRHCVACNPEYRH